MTEQAEKVRQPISVIVEARVSEGRIVVDWADGHLSRFHPLWLRDNCQCPLCGNRSVGQKLTSVVDIDPDVAANRVTLDASHRLRIEWSGDAHLSVYEADWLREHCYSEGSRDSRLHRPILWDSDLQSNLPEITREECFRDDAGHYRLLSAIRDYGFALVHGVACERESFLAMAERIGYVKETNYGKVSDLVAKGGAPKTLSDTKHGIPLHTDECYRHANPGLLAFQCVSSSADGKGATLLADGFRMAEQLREREPEAFDFLSRVALPSRRHHPGEADLRSQSPVLRVDFEGRIQGVRYNERSAAPMDLPEALIEPAYRALRSWLALGRDPGFRVRLLLKAGDFIVFDNQRVLHGREDFTGDRHLLYCQLDLDEPHSRARVLAQRLGLEPAGLIMHRGA